MTLAGSRREARERALALLYEAEAKGEAPADVVEALPVEPDAYAAGLVLGVGEHGSEIDGLLGRYSRGWKLERMPSIDRALLRIGVYELLFEPGVPTAAVVSEAVELASEYSTDESGRFVNGLLARIAREVRDDEGVPLDLAFDVDPAGPEAGTDDSADDLELDTDPEVDEEADLPTTPGAEVDTRSADLPSAEGRHTGAPDGGPEGADDESAEVPEAAGSPSVAGVVGPSAQAATAAVPARSAPPLALPQPPLGDGVIRLRPWQPSDAPALASAWADPAVARWSAPPSARSTVDARRWIDRTPALRERGLSLDLVVAGIGARPEVLGEVGLAAFDDDGGAEIGYWIAAAHRRRGHATRAVRLLSTWAVHHLGLRRLVAVVDPANGASVGVVRRAGYRAESPGRWVYPPN